MLESTGIAIAMVHSILIVIDIVGNCLVCAIIKKNRDMRYVKNTITNSSRLICFFDAIEIYFRDLWRAYAYTRLGLGVTGEG